MYFHVTSLHFEEDLLTFGNSSLIHFPYFATFTGNFSYFSRSDVFPENIGHLWTISLEEQYYVLICIGIIFYGRIKNRVLFYFGSLFVVGSLSKLAILFLKIEYPAIWVLPMARLDTISIGGIIALIVRRLENSQHVLLKIKRPLNFVTLIVTISIFAVPDPRSITLNNCIITIIPSIFSALLIIHCTILESLLKQILSLKPLELLGRITFGLYVFHFIGINIASEFIRKYESEIYIWNYLLFLSSAFFITITLALSSYLGLELAFLRKKVRFNALRLASTREASQVT